jgi:uncharacterized membrane protein
MQKPTTSTGMAENVEGLLCYLVTWITGIVFLIIEKNSKLIKFHAMQSLITFASINVIQIILSFIPIIGWAINGILWILEVILWIVLMVKTYQGKKFMVPITGKIAENWAAKQEIPPQAKPQ